jgi:hypothetical protein
MGAWLIFGYLLKMTRLNRIQFHFLALPRGRFLPVPALVWMLTLAKSMLPMAWPTPSKGYLVSIQRIPRQICSMVDASAVL